MRFSREQARERTIDYLYGELAGEELRAFEAALREFSELAREVDALRQTLSLTRETLRANSREPPKSARAAVLAAARAHAASALVVPAPQREQRVIALEPRRSFWSFLRTPWLFPAFGVCAAIAFVVVRERNAQPEIARAPAPTAAPSEAAPMRDEMPSDFAPAADVLHEEESAKREAPASGALRARSGGAGPANAKGAPSAQTAQPFPSEPMARSASKPTATRARAAAPRPSRERSEGEGALAEPFPGAVLAERASSDRARDDEPKDFALSDERDRRVEERATGGGASAVQRSPAKAAPSPGALGSVAAEGAGAEAKRAPDPADPAGPLILRAQAAQKAGRHRDAVTLYRELLGRFPADPRVPSWRRELERHERALSAQQRDARVGDD